MKGFTGTALIEGGGTKGGIYSLCRILHSAPLVVYIDSRVQEYWLETHVTQVINLPLTTYWTQRALWSCVTRYALKITYMQYLCVTVAMPGNPWGSWRNHVTCHAFLDCTKLKTSHCNQHKLFPCKTAKQVFVGLQFSNSSFTQFISVTWFVLELLYYNIALAKKYWSVRCEKSSFLDGKRYKC